MRGSYSDRSSRYRGWWWEFCCVNSVGPSAEAMVYFNSNATLPDCRGARRLLAPMSFIACFRI